MSECCGHNCGCHTEEEELAKEAADAANPFAEEEAQNAKNGAFLVKLFIGATIVIAALCAIIKFL